MRRTLIILVGLVVALSGFNPAQAWRGSWPPNAWAVAGLHPGQPTETWGMYDGGSNWAVPDSSFPFRTASGDLGLAVHSPAESRLAVTTFDAVTGKPVGSTVRLDLTGWPEWGGFLAAPDGTFYVAVGRTNLGQSNARHVVAVRRYTPSGTLIGTGYLPGGARQMFEGVRVPFHAAAADMAVVGHRLVVHMAREMYTAKDGLNHQSNLTFEMDTETFAVRTFSELGANPYASHSFRQFVGMSGTSLVMVDHGDAYPRSLQLSVMADYPNSRSVEQYELMNWFGDVGDNFTGASITGMTTSATTTHVVGQSLPTKTGAATAPVGWADGVRNVFLTTATTATGAASTTWLTQHAANAPVTVWEPRIVALADGTSVVLWSESTGTRVTTHYVRVAADGTHLARASFAGTFFTPISDPVQIGNQLYWVGRPFALVTGAADSDSNLYWFRLNLADPNAPALVRGAQPAVCAVVHATYASGSVVKQTHALARTGTSVKGAAKAVRLTRGRWRLQSRVSNRYESRSSLTVRNQGQACSAGVLGGELARVTLTQTYPYRSTFTRTVTVSVVVKAKTLRKAKRLAQVRAMKKGIRAAAGSASQRDAQLKATHRKWALWEIEDKVNNRIDETS